MAKSIKTNIVEHLKKKGNYDPDVDDYNIDLLLENLEFARQMKNTLEDEGCVVATANGNGIISTKMNPAFGIWQMCQRNIHQAAAKLGISRNDRLKLKLIEQKEQDALDDLLND